MKKAFTMIELIFVIVILGILAAVALPKFLGVANQAHEGNLKSFVGTLNRSVGPTLWSEAISTGKDGNVTALEVNLSKYTDIPKEIGKDINISNCSDSTSSYKVIVTTTKDKAGADYFIACKTGNTNQAPVFHLFKGAAKLDDNNKTNVDSAKVGDTVSFDNGSGILVQ